MRKNFNKELLKILLESVCIDDEYSEYEGDTKKPTKIQTLKKIYNNEYGFFGITQGSCKEWLMGLPSSCTVPFYNNEIHNIGYDIGYLNPNSSDTAHCNWVESYWQRMGIILCQQLNKV